MSNRRKTNHPGGDRDRERRHMAWLNTADNGARLTAAAQAAYEDQGRGFWYIPEDSEHLGYLPAAVLGTLPAGRHRDVLSRMVATYNPDTQVVVAIEDEGRISAYKVRHIQPALN